MAKTLKIYVKPRVGYLSSFSPSYLFSLADNHKKGTYCTKPAKRAPPSSLLFAWMLMIRGENQEGGRRTTDWAVTECTHRTDKPLCNSKGLHLPQLTFLPPHWGRSEAFGKRPGHKGRALLVRSDCCSSLHCLSPNLLPYSFPLLSLTSLNTQEMYTPGTQIAYF